MQRSPETHATGPLPAAVPPPLAEAKLAPPRARSGLVARPRIAGALDAGAEGSLTLVAAPVGYGKTTAVRAWCAARDAPLAWVTLDAADNDPFNLWTYIATAVERACRGSGRAALRRLSVAGGPIAAPIDDLMNGIASASEDVVIVLDDLQTVTDREALRSIDHALSRLPANARLIAITRTDPALRLPHLRATGALTELRASELAFTEKETHDLLVAQGRIDLEPAEIELLRSRTEGWPAALMLAGLWLRGEADRHRAVRRFGGDHRFVADYLGQEAFDSLAEDVRWFLTRVCVLRRFTAAMCDAVFERSDSAAMLAELERSNLFVVPLEPGDWYRVHSLVAEFAHFQLASDAPGAETEIHRRAAAWLRVHGHPIEAAEHAAKAGDQQFVAQMLAEYHLALLRSGRAQLLLRWVQALPDAQVVEHPELAVGGATAATMLGSAFDRRRLLNLAARAEVDQPERVTPYVQAVAAFVRAAAVDGDVSSAVLEGRRAVEIAQAGADEVLVGALGAYARALYLAGELDEAWDAALRAVEHPDAARRTPGHTFARSTLALVAVERGRLRTARIHADKARSLVGRVGSSRSWLGANASVALGSVLAGEDSLAEAERELAYAEHFFRDEVPTVHHAWLLTLLARVRCRRGRLAEAEATLQQALAMLEELGDSGIVPSLAEAVERQLKDANRRARSGEVTEAPSRAELAVLRLLASDLSVPEIAGELFLTANTVRSHTRSIYRKLGVNSRVQAVARADALDLLARSEP